MIEADIQGFAFVRGAPIPRYRAAVKRMAKGYPESVEANCFESLDVFITDGARCNLQLVIANSRSVSLLISPRFIQVKPFSRVETRQLECLFSVS